MFLSKILSLELCFSNGASIAVINLIIMMILAYPAIRLFSAYRMNYSECIGYFIKNKKPIRIFVYAI